MICPHRPPLQKAQASKTEGLSECDDDVSSFQPPYDEYDQRNNSILQKILRKFTIRNSSSTIKEIKEVKGTSVMNVQTQKQQKIETFKAEAEKDILDWLILSTTFCIVQTCFRLFELIIQQIDDDEGDPEGRAWLVVIIQLAMTLVNVFFVCIMQQSSTLTTIKIGAILSIFTVGLCSIGISTYGTRDESSGDGQSGSDSPDQLPNIEALLQEHLYSGIATPIACSLMVISSKFIVNLFSTTKSQLAMFVVLVVYIILWLTAQNLRIEARNMIKYGIYLLINISFIPVALYLQANQRQRVFRQYLFDTERDQD